MKRFSIELHDSRFSIERVLGASRAPAAGFSVPELLAVIAVILIIISLLLPNLNSSKEVARRSICMSQLHQHMVAARSYSVDRKRLPAMREKEKINGVNKWYTYADRLVLFNYLSAYDVFYCPSQDVNKYFKRNDPRVPPLFNGSVRRE